MDEALNTKISYGTQFRQVIMNSIYIDTQSQPPHIGEVQKARLRHSGQFQNELSFELAQSSKVTTTKGAQSSNQSLVHLGHLSSQNPTVSHLLVNHPEYSGECWTIIHHSANQAKPFRQLMLGQDVWLNPQTKEIVLDSGQEQVAPTDTSPAVISPVARVQNNYPSSSEDVASVSKTDTYQDVQVRPAPASFLAPAFSFTSPTLEDREEPEHSTQNLSQAVAAYRGQPYSNLDCYELVVQGLKDLGLQYSGQKGLQNALIQEAKANNLPLNSLLTGEGLISSLGQAVVQKKLNPELNSITQQLEELFSSLHHRLEPGMLLSFSTRSRGHTGVISSFEDTWTFINSGRIDNSVHPGDNGQQVGEEDLFQELMNWVQRAAHEGSHLQVTVGRLEQDKMASYQTSANLKA